MITDNPDTNSRPSESPSADPTLRERLQAILHAYWRSVTGEEKDELVSVYPLPSTIAALEQLCQEIAREARLDELKLLDRQSWTATDMHIKKRIAELTQKPQGDSRE